jgi:hypothetical protein
MGSAIRFAGSISYSFARSRARKMAFAGDFSPVLAKHSKRFSLEDALSIGVDRMQRNFEPLRRQVESWRAELLSAEARQS